MCALKTTTEETSKMKMLTSMDAWQQANTRWKVAFCMLMLLPLALVAGVVVMEVVVALIGILFLWDSHVRREWAWARTPFFRIALIAWVWLVAVASPLGLNPPESFNLAIPWIRYALLMMAMRYWLLKSPEALLALMKSCLLVMGLSAIDTLWQLKTGTSLTGHTVGEFARLTGPFQGPKIGFYLAKLLVPVMAIALLWFFSDITRHKPGMAVRLVLALLCVTFLTLIFLSGGRVAFATTFVATSGMLLALAIWQKSLRRKMLLLAALAGAAFVLLLNTHEHARAIVDRTQRQLAAMSASSSTATHWIVLKTGWQVGTDHWQHGVGMHGFREVAAQKYNAATNRELFPEGYLHTHNTYTEWFAEAGLVGFLCCLAFVFVLLREAWATFRRTAGVYRVIPAAMLGICFMNFFPLMTTTSYFNNWAGVMTWFSVGFVYCLTALVPAARRV